ncbi:MAG: serine/threonine-protein phosphatase [Flavobacteriales bacterium]|nr:serine/threonine-protein phosphatase [Flavobacteriales bacterium]
MPQLVAPIYLGVILHLFLIPAMLVGIVLLKKIKHSLLFTGFIIAVYLLIEVIKFRSQISSTSISTPFFILYIFDVIIIFFSIYYYISQFKSIDNGYIIDIIKQQKKIKKQHLELSKTHDKIKQSIDYALKIQSALLPHTDTITTIIDNHFLLYLPKDIVAGDFYWVEEDEDYKYLAIADCTGHGVPGALVSIVCINALNRAIHEFELSNTGAILDQTRAIIIEELNDSKNHIADGMDISLLKIPKDNNTTNLMIEFSGANNSIYIVRDNQLIEFNGCKQPIGSHINMQPFKTQKIPAYKNDTVYLFTDGYPDQFGGVKGKKFKKKPFKELLLSISNLPPREQSVQLKNTLNSWKSNIEQVDDITILGFKLS